MVFTTSHKKRVAVLRGGPSTEYDVSMQTGSGVIDALTAEGYDVKDIIISRKGEWLLHGFVKQPVHALLDVDAVFIALHGAYGEDGTVQRILERLHIPYTGSDAYASALAMNKSLTKDYLKKHVPSIKMAPHLKITRSGTAIKVNTVVVVIVRFLCILAVPCDLYCVAFNQKNGFFVVGSYSSCFGCDLKLTRGS